MLRKPNNNALNRKAVNQTISDVDFVEGLIDQQTPPPPCPAFRDVDGNIVIQMPSVVADDLVVSGVAICLDRSGSMATSTGGYYSNLPTYHQLQHNAAHACIMSGIELTAMQAITFDNAGESFTIPLGTTREKLQEILPLSATQPRGGTSLLPALKLVKESNTLIVMTDGAIWDIDDAISYINGNLKSPRIIAVGIGNSFDPKTVNVMSTEFRNLNRLIELGNSHSQLFLCRDIHALDDSMESIWTAQATVDGQALPVAVSQSNCTYVVALAGQISSASGFSVRIGNVCYKVEMCDEPTSQMQKDIDFIQCLWQDELEVQEAAAREEATFRARGLTTHIVKVLLSNAAKRIKRGRIGRISLKTLGKAQRALEKQRKIPDTFRHLLTTLEDPNAPPFRGTNRTVAEAEPLCCLLSMEQELEPLRALLQAPRSTIVQTSNADILQATHPLFALVVGLGRRTGPEGVALGLQNQLRATEVTREVQFVTICYESIMELARQNGLEVTGDLFDDLAQLAGAFDEDVAQVWLDTAPTGTAKHRVQFLESLRIFASSDQESMMMLPVISSCSEAEGFLMGMSGTMRLVLNTSLTGAPQDSNRTYALGMLGVVTTLLGVSQPSQHHQDLIRHLASTCRAVGISLTTALATYAVDMHQQGKTPLSSVWRDALAANAEDVEGLREALRVNRLNLLQLVLQAVCDDGVDSLPGLLDLTTLGDSFDGRCAVATLLAVTYLQLPYIVGPKKIEASRQAIRQVGAALRKRQLVGYVLDHTAMISGTETKTLVEILGSDCILFSTGVLSLLPAKNQHKVWAQIKHEFTEQNTVDEELLGKLLQNASTSTDRDALRLQEIVQLTAVVTSRHDLDVSLGELEAVNDECASVFDKTNNNRARAVFEQAGLERLRQAVFAHRQNGVWIPFTDVASVVCGLEQLVTELAGDVAHVALLVLQTASEDENVYASVAKNTVRAIMQTLDAGKKLSRVADASVVLRPQFRHMIEADAELLGFPATDPTLISPLLSEFMAIISRGHGGANIATSMISKRLALLKQTFGIDAAPNELLTIMTNLKIQDSSLRKDRVLETMHYVPSMPAEMIASDSGFASLWHVATKMSAVKQNMLDYHCRQTKGGGRQNGFVHCLIRHPECFSSEYPALCQNNAFWDLACEIAGNAISRPTYDANGALTKPHSVNASQELIDTFREAILEPRYVIGKSHVSGRYQAVMLTAVYLAEGVEIDKNSTRAAIMAYASYQPKPQESDPITECSGYFHEESAKLKLFKLLAHL